MKVISQQLVDRVDVLEPSHIVKAVYGLGKFHFVEDGGVSLGILTAQARRRIWNYSIDDCAQLISSLSRVKLKNAPFITRVVDRIDDQSIKSSSFIAIVNLMMALSRFGIKDTKQRQVWQILANELTSRLSKIQSLDTYGTRDICGALLSFSYPNVKKPHQELFQVASECISHRSDMTFSDVLKYIKACARVQFRDIPTLSHCALTLRSLNEFSTRSREDLLDLHTNLDKLGADIAELNQELEARGISINRPVEDPTWFRSQAPGHRRKSILNNNEARSIRSRKHSW